MFCARSQIAGSCEELAPQPGSPESGREECACFRRWKTAITSQSGTVVCRCNSRHRRQTSILGAVGGVRSFGKA